MLPFPILFTVLAAQFIYIVVNWAFFTRKEYGYYLCYVLLFAAYFLNKYSAGSDGMVQLAGFTYYKLIPDKILAIACYLFYFKFGRHFVEASTRYPFINRLMKHTEVLLICFICYDILLLGVTGDLALENTLFFPVNLIIFAVLGVTFTVMVRRNEVLDRFILTGSMFYGVCAFLTMLFGQGLSPLDDRHMIILQVGALVEMILLNAGLVYKSKMLQNTTIRSQKQLIERYEENLELNNRIGKIREEISRDIHDDLGATLSSVKIYSEILETNSSDAILAHLIKDNTAEMIEKLELIAWASNPVNDHFLSLRDQMMKYAAPLLHSKNIQFQFETKIEDEFPMPGEARRNILLIFKEAINNAAKYSSAHTTVARLHLNGNKINFEIVDDGRGITGQLDNNRNGLKNMRRRAEELGGGMIISSGARQGTRLEFHFPYPFQYSPENPANPKDGKAQTTANTQRVVKKIAK